MQPGDWMVRIRKAWGVLRGFSVGDSVSAAVSGPAEPRQFEHPIGWNRAYMPRRDGPGLTPFEQLRNLAGVYDVAAICIASLIEEFQRKKWVIAPMDKGRLDLGEEMERVRRFWLRPDGFSDFGSWLTVLLYDLLTIDAVTLYKRLNRGGRLWGLELVDGATIKPLLDERGRVMRYQQILYGRPESEFVRPEVGDGYGPDQLLYRPRWVRSFTPYGFPPTEWIILRINMALRKQTFDLAYFADGNIPEMLAFAPEGIMTPTQIQEFEEYFNSVLEGSDEARRKMRFVPFKTEVKELRPFSYETPLDYFMMQITCAAYGRMPQALGFVESVNRAQGVVQNDITELREDALANWLKGAIFDPVIQDDLGCPGLEWLWLSDRIIEDEAAEAVVHQGDIAAGVISAQESRVLRYGDRLRGKAPQLLEKRGEDDSDRDVLEGVGNGVMAQVYREQLGRVMAVLEGAVMEGVGDDLGVLWGGELGRVEQDVMAFFDRLAQAAARLALKGIGGADWELVNRVVLQLARERARAFALQMSEASEVLTAEVVADWVSTGGTMKDLMARVARVWEGRRPDVAAVDAVTDVFARGQRLAWEASGVVKGYVISTARDSHVCSVCGPRDGEYHDIGDVDGLPGFHNRCRCDIRPVVKKPEDLWN